MLVKWTAITSGLRLTALSLGERILLGHQESSVGQHPSYFWQICAFIVDQRAENNLIGTKVNFYLSRSGDSTSDRSWFYSLKTLEGDALKWEKCVDSGTANAVL